MNQFKSAIRKAGLRQTTMSVRLDVGLPGRLGSGPLGAANYELGVTLIG